MRTTSRSMAGAVARPARTAAVLMALTAAPPALASPLAAGDTARPPADSAEELRRAPRGPSRAVQARRARIARALAERTARRALPAGRGDPYLLYAEDFRLADSVAGTVPAADGASIEALGAYFLRTLPSEAARARAVFRWITGNVDYDADAFFGSRLGIPVQSAGAVFQRRRAVCDGYAYLTLALGRAAGVETEVLDGDAKAFSGDPRAPIRIQGHAWNAMRVDGRWWLLDASWGAGDIQDRRFVRRVRDHHFFTPPEQMAFSHRPDDAAWQLLANPVTEGEFVRMTPVPRDFWELGIDAGRLRRAAAEGLRGGLVPAFAVPGRGVRIMEAPLHTALEPGATYAFRIRAPGATAVFAVDGATWHPLADSAGVFAGAVTTSGERLMILVRYADLPEGVVVLAYGTGSARRSR